MGDAVVAAVREGQFYIFTRAEYAPFLARRFGEINQALNTSAAPGPADDIAYLGQGVSGY